MQLKRSSQRLLKLALLTSFISLWAIFDLSTKRVAAFSSGPPSRHTGAPGESDCTACHTSFPLNSGSGSVTITGLPQHYTPGQVVTVTVTTRQADPEGAVFGFQITSITAAGAQGGMLAVTDPTHTQMVTGTVNGNLRAYIEHTFDGTMPVVFHERSWSFSWTAPATNAGPITFYAAGNGGDGENGSNGDYIYTSQTTIACNAINGANSQSFAANGGASSFNIAGSACSWTAVSNHSWIHTSSNGMGNGVVNYTVDANPDPSPRTGTITVDGLTFTVYQGVQFSDVPNTHTFYTEIGKLSARGITLGCGGGNYCPDAAVTREQMAAFIIRALHEPGYIPPTPMTQRFVDVPPSNTFYAHIEEMAVRQITLGCGGNNYCPTTAVTREQMAAFIIRALHEPGYIPPTPMTQRFADVPPSNPFYAHIDEMAVLMITLGCGGDNYCPTASVTRAQMAAFLVRAFNL
jgi:hypothetical protein